MTHRFAVLAAIAAALVFAPGALAATARVDNGTLQFSVPEGGSSAVSCQPTFASLQGSATCTVSAAVVTPVAPDCLPSGTGGSAVCSNVTRVAATLADTADSFEMSGPVDASVAARGGADLLLVGRSAGADTISGGAGTDVVSYAGRSAAVTLSFNKGARSAGEEDQVDQVEQVIGTDFADTLRDAGASSGSRIEGGSGNDTLDGGTGDDDLRGDAGDDKLTGGPDDAATDSDQLLGGAGNDTLTGGSGSWDGLFGEAGNDTIRGGPGDDLCSGGEGDDSVHGEAGGDALYGHAGTNVLTGGDGRDMVHYYDSFSAVGVVARLGGTATRPGQHDTLGDDIEDLRGSRGNDVLIGNAGRNYMQGEDGADTFDGGSVDGGADAGDTYIGFTGLNQDSHVDTVTYAARTQAITVTMGIDSVDGGPGEGDEVPMSIDAVIGGSGDDRITGDTDFNTLRGGRGADVLDGGIGSSADSLDGGEGDDLLRGGGGADTLAAGFGADVVEGADGNDKIDIRDAEQDEATCGAGTDSVTGDRLDLVEASSCETVQRVGPAALSVADITVAEGAGTATFTVRTDIPATVDVRAQFATSDGSAGAPGDYAARSGEVAIAAGGSEAVVSVPIEQDALDEPDESFSLDLSQAAGATIADGSASASIIDDDAAPAISVADPAAEAESGGPVRFRVSLSAPSGRTVRVANATRDGSAAAGSDYQATSGLLELAPGETAATIEARLLDDSLDEPEETFALVLSHPENATLGTAEAVAKIGDDDPPSISLADARAPEGDRGASTATLAVRLSSSAEGPVTVRYATADGTASAGKDYLAAAGTLVIPAGATTAEIAVSVLGDRKREGEETVAVTLADPAGATLGRATATLTIEDDD